MFVFWQLASPPPHPQGVNPVARTHIVADISAEDVFINIRQHRSNYYSIWCEFGCNKTQIPEKKSATGFEEKF